MFNLLILEGRLTAAPELRTTDNGRELIRFSVAVKRNRPDIKGEYPTDFFNCVSFGKTSEFISRNFNKGDCIIVYGEMQQYSYKNKSGEKRIGYEMLISAARFPDGNQKCDDNPNAADGQTYSMNFPLPNDENLPF